LEPAVSKRARENDIKRQSAAQGVRMRNHIKILSAAEEVFAEKGFDGATTQEIADRAGLPKANVHYYFRTKKDIYLAVMTSIMGPWLEAFQAISADDDPTEALSDYIRRKVMLSKERPLASRIFANEMIRGAPVLSQFLKSDLTKWIDEKADILRQWAKLGKMDPVPPEHLFFVIWAATQTYADFEVQVRSILRRDRLTSDDFDTASDFIATLILKGCGVRPHDQKTGRKSPSRST
jgi:TetR/AcrR family transcriptional regulator